MVNTCKEYFLVKHCFLLIATALCFSYSSELTAQTSINSTQFIEQYLLEVKKDFQLSTLPGTYENPWIETIELRTQTNDFDFAQQRYAIRIRPIPKTVRSAQQRIVDLLKEESEYKRTTYFDEFVKEAYKEWLRIRGLHQQVQIQKKLQVVYEDIEKVLLKMGQMEGLNIKDLLEVQRDKTATTITIESLQKSLANYIGTALVSDSDLLPIAAIHKAVHSTIVGPTLLKKEQTNEKLLVQAEIDLERAERQNILDFVQFQYQGPTTDPWEEQVAISASVNIPFSKKANLKERELQIEQALLEEEFQLKNVEKEQKVKHLKRTIIRLIEHYELSQQLLLAQQQRTNNLIAKAAIQSSISPLLELYQQIEQDQQSLDLLKLESAIYQEYIDYLDETGFLYQTPFKNFLVKEN